MGRRRRHTIQCADANGSPEEGEAGREEEGEKEDLLEGVSEFCVVLAARMWSRVVVAERNERKDGEEGCSYCRGWRRREGAWKGAAWGDVM